VFNVRGENKMKASAIAIALSLAALTAFAQAWEAPARAAPARVDLTAVIGKDFIGTPTFDQAARALEAEAPLVGFGWEVLMGRVGLGGSYAVDFNEEPSSQWWLDWEAQAIYASYHILGAKSFVDPFVDAGLGCAGRVFLGPEGDPGTRLALAIYPFASAGAALELDGLRVGAKLSYALNRSGVPVTSIPVYPLGRFQVSAFAGLSIGGR
jgi:hypothetical protein